LYWNTTFYQAGSRSDLFVSNAGVSRAPTIATAYVMRKKKCTVDEALEFVKSKCPAACPNPGFVKQLNQYYKKLSERWKKQNPTPTPPANEITPSANETRTAETANVNTVDHVANVTATQETPVEEKIEKKIEPTKYYTCRKCRTRLFDDTEMIEHVPGEGQQSFDWNKRA